MAKSQHRGPRAAIYIRVSTIEQNPEMQLADLQKFASDRKFQVVRIYTDRVTGDLEKRNQTRTSKDAAYKQLMADAHRRHFDCVLVWKFDRFARSLSGLIGALQTFSSLGIDFVSVTQQVDTTTPMGRLLFHLVAAFAEFERELIVERTRVGLANARRKGIRLGRPRKPILDRRIREMRASGQSLRQIAAAVGMSAAGVKRSLDRSL